MAAIRYTENGAQWFHAGLLYRHKGEARLFEMPTHKTLADGKAPPGFVWVEPEGVGRERLRLAYTRARLVEAASKTSDVPYGFKFASSTFDERGIYRRAEGEVGLTCSTIVVAILEAEEIRLLDPKAWPLADEADKTARRGVIASIAKADPEHAKVLTAEIGAPRIRPEEVVAAAATFQDRLGTFDNLQVGAVVVADRTVPVPSPASAKAEPSPRTTKTPS